MTHLLRRHGLSRYGLQRIHDVTLYPREYFYPYPWFGKFTPECVTAETLCIHHWEGSWVEAATMPAAAP